MSSNTVSHTGTTTTSIAATDIRDVLSHMGYELLTIRSAAPDIPCDTDLGEALVDTSLLALNDVIASVHLQFFTNGELVREYQYLIADGALESFGPGADDPPLAEAFPPGTRLRLVVTDNPAQDARIRAFWFQKLGWTDASPLSVPEDVRVELYGTFASGGYGVERRLLTNPKFDRSASPSTTHGKGRE